MRGRGLAFLAGRASAKNRTQQTEDVSSGQSSQTDQLQELRKLHDDGTLTDAEFADAKKKVLSGK